MNNYGLHHFFATALQKQVSFRRSFRPQHGGGRNLYPSAIQIKTMSIGEGLCWKASLSLQQVEMNCKKQQIRQNKLAEKFFRPE
jgi:hypothetical protein